MIGAGLAQAVTQPPVPIYSVDLNPGEIDVISNKGAASSPRVFSTVNNGTGPFTYLWTSNNGRINIEASTASDTNFLSSGSNEVVTGSVTLTVTDTGNGDTETSKNISVFFSFN